MKGSYPSNKGTATTEAQIEKPSADRPPSTAGRFAELYVLRSTSKEDEKPFREEIEKGGPVNISLTDPSIEETKAKTKTFDPLPGFPHGNCPTELQDIVNSFKGASSPLDFQKCKSIRPYLHRWLVQIESIRKMVLEETEAAKVASGPILKWLAHIPQDLDRKGKPRIGPYFTQHDARTADILKKWLQLEYADKVMKKYEISDDDWRPRLSCGYNF